MDGYLTPDDAMRLEEDTIGEMQLPANCVYGIHTARALCNFPISGVPLSHFPELVGALAMVKKAAAMANCEVGDLAPDLARAIITTCDEICAGQHHKNFVVDMVQGGAGTSTNMNANEVIANLTLERLGHNYGDYRNLHPNDHVNRSQSTNDVYPTALRLAVLSACAPLLVQQKRLSAAFAERAQAFEAVMKVGRTQMQDAVPITLGMEFASFADTVDEDIERLQQASELLKEVNLGGTAVGTGVNAPSGYAERAIDNLAAISGHNLIAAKNRIEASSDLGAFVMFSSTLKRIAVKISKICNDLRLLSSGPRAGLGEISLPPVQAGSSIMPGKVNPVIPEVVNQVAYQVIGNDLTVTLAAEAGQLQLNAMEPVLILNVLQSIRMLTRAFQVLTDRCVNGIEANTERCQELLERSLVLATALAPLIGYERATEIAKIAHRTNSTVAEVAVQTGAIEASDISSLLTAEAMLSRAIRQKETP